jgi:hypothetical protein
MHGGPSGSVLQNAVDLESWMIQKIKATRRAGVFHKENIGGDVQIDDIGRNLRFWHDGNDTMDER